VEAHGADCELPFFKQIGLIPPELTRADLIEATAGMLAATGVEGVSVGLDGSRGVVSPHELVAQALQQLGHRQYLLRHTLRCYELSGCPPAAAPAASFQSRSVEQCARRDGFDQCVFDLERRAAEERTGIELRAVKEHDWKTTGPFACTGQEGSATDTLRFHSIAAGRPPTHLMPMFAAERRRSASCAP